MKRCAVALPAVVLILSGCATPETVTVERTIEVPVTVEVPATCPVCATEVPKAESTPDPMPLAAQKAAAIEACLHDASKDFEGRAAQLLATAIVLSPDITFSNSPAYPYETTMVVLGDIRVGVTAQEIVRADYRFEGGQWVAHSFTDPYLPGVEDAKGFSTIVGCL